MPYPEGISVEHRRPGLGDDFYTFVIRDSQSGLSRDVSVSYRVLYSASDRGALIADHVNLAVRELLHSREEPRVTDNFVYNPNFLTEEDLAVHSEPYHLEPWPLRAVTEAGSKAEADPKEKIRRNLPL